MGIQRFTCSIIFHVLQMTTYRATLTSYHEKITCAEQKTYTMAWQAHE